MGTSGMRPDDGSPAGGVGTITRPGTERAAPQAAPLAPPSRVPPQRTGRPGRRRPARPGQPVRPGQPGQPGHPAQPAPPGQLGQPGQPVRPGHPGRPGQAAQPLAPGTAADAAPRAAERGLPLRSQRMPFFFVLCALLGGALICALVISTTLAEGSYQITRLEQANGALARQQQLLQAQVAAAQSAQVIEQRAVLLGMRPVGELRFLNLKNGKIETDAGVGPTADIHVPGYTP